jgi:hypothetical protein
MGRRSRLAAALLATGLLLSACGSTPAGGDPGGKRLLELRRDPVFAAFPVGATAVDVTRTPAKYRKPGFSGGGWDGPSVVVSFKSSEPPADVFGFFGLRAASSGWHATASGALGLTDRWRKQYQDGAAATLLLAPLRGGLYRLYGGVAPVGG